VPAPAWCADPTPSTAARRLTNDTYLRAYTRAGSLAFRCRLTSRDSSHSPTLLERPERDPSKLGKRDDARMLPKAPPTRREREVGRRTTDARGCNSTRVENSNRAVGRIQFTQRGVAASLTASVRASQGRNRVVHAGHVWYALAVPWLTIPHYRTRYPPTS
jgi:hypothetical protein